MNSNLIPLLYPLQPGFMDADQWIDQLLNNPATINWQAAFRHSLDTDTVGACIFDVDQNTGFKAVSYTHLRAHETVLDLVCRLLLEKQTKDSPRLPNCAS